MRIPFSDRYPLFFAIKPQGGAFTIAHTAHQINEEIRDKEVRLISAQGEQLGILPIAEAMAKAAEAELDLVKISPNAVPPVCKLMDYGKYRFEQTKREKEAKKNQRIVEIKEVRMSPGIDVNDFKAINDTYGHVEGDRALKIIAESLREVVRRHGEPIFLARYGGDEFSLIVHAAGEGDVDSLAREIREEIKAKCREKGTPYRISVGIGWDALLERPDTFQKCMERADRRLYLDKEYCKMQLRAEGRP